MGYEVTVRGRRETTWTSSVSLTCGFLTRIDQVVSRRPLSDGASVVVVGADTYQLEGPLTTFFSTDAGRRVVDCWSVRLASFRTVDVVRIRRVEERQAA